jgi:hypothetical protein
MNVNAQIDIEAIRQRWRQAQAGKLGDELVAFCELSSHPDCRWQDLLDALDRPNSVGEDAWVQLRGKLREHVGIAGTLRRDRAFWDAAIREAGIDPMSRCSRGNSVEGRL